MTSAYRIEIIRLSAVAAGSLTRPSRSAGSLTCPKVAELGPLTCSIVAPLGPEFVLAKINSKEIKSNYLYISFKYFSRQPKQNGREK